MNRQPAVPGPKKPPVPTPVPRSVDESIGQLFKAVSFGVKASRKNGHK